MRLERYDPRVAEPRLAERWEEAGVYAFQPGDAERPVYSIDTPPPTVSGFLHLGNVYSYSHADFMARFWRMNGYNVYYPMGYDDNGLPTERLVERLTGTTAEEIGREAFIRACLQTSREYEGRYEALFRRLGLSIDWRYTYRTIDDLARKTSQASFLGLLRDGHAYRRQAPTIWCPTCHTAIAQAEEKDIDRDSEIVTIAFRREDGSTLPIATTRPELLPACVAVFVHPDDARYRDLAGQTVRVPLFDLEVPVLRDAHADPSKGTGAVMCCTFGDTIDVEWWYTHELPLREAIDRHGRMTPLAGPFADLTVEEARRATIAALEAEGLLLNALPMRHSVRAHERCDTPVEYVVTPQWFVRVLDRKAELLQAGDAVTWHPDHMRVRYREWVEGLHWDWCISRQRYYGVPFPVWLCDVCGEVVPADESQLPVDPTTTGPPRSCECGSDSLRPEEDVMDTWATSAVSPQIAGRQQSDPALYERVFPMALRPQAHEIIRTWAFDTIVMSLYLYGTLPWRDVFISGWGVAPGGAEKISKSRGGGPMTPMETLDRYGADAVRYWAGSTGTGKDAVISEEKMAAGAKLVTKLWSVASFSARFLEGFEEPAELPSLSPADRWIVSRAERLKGLATAAFRDYEYAVAKNETEGFFWRDLCDNYLEMAKKRLYDGTEDERTAACFALSHSFYTVLVLLAPIMPFVTEEIYGALFRRPGAAFLQGTRWPEVQEELIDTDAEAAGEALVAIATAVRRYKSERNLSLGAPLAELRLTVRDGWLGDALYGGEVDIASITRAQTVVTGDGAGPDGLETVLDDPQLGLLVQVGSVEG